MAKKISVPDVKVKPKPQPKPGLKVTSIFGESRIEITDGVNTVEVKLTKKGVEALIAELQIVLDMAD